MSLTGCFLLASMLIFSRQSICLVLLGIFTTRNISNGDAVLGGPDGLAIPIEDYGDREGEEWGKKKTHWINLWGESKSSALLNLIFVNRSSCVCFFFVCLTPLYPHIDFHFCNGR
jgi:hypothetical protein